MPGPLADFLRAARAAARPDPAHDRGARRQVAGLRREEVAVTAGISADYYQRLEQGRETGPSPQVLDALAGALQLTPDAHQHLYRIAGLAPRPRLTAPTAVSDGMQRMLAGWSELPAFVLGPAYDVLAWNPLGAALFGGFDRSPNLVQRVFLDPAARSFYADWDTAAANTVAGLRLNHGRHPDDERIRAVVHDTAQRSPEFSALWDVNRAEGKRSTRKRFLHPEVGGISLEMLVFDVRDGSGHELVVYQAEAGSPDADALTLLGTLAASSADA